MAGRAGLLNCVELLVTLISVSMKTFFKIVLAILVASNILLLPSLFYSHNRRLTPASCPQCENVPLSSPKLQPPPPHEQRKGWQSERLAVIIPHRERFRELVEIVPYLSDFLMLQKIPFTIWVLNQIDSHRFNRGLLLNLGFILASNSCEYICLHDVDLLPLNHNISYRFHSAGPVHLTSPELHPVYHFEKFFGGVLQISNRHYQLTNGFSNVFWGWGREDDEFFLRVKEAGLQVSRPQGITTGHETFYHNHLPDRKRDSKLYFNQKVVSFRRDRTGGLDTTLSSVHSYKVHELSFDGYPCKLVNVKLNCDYDFTPFCDPPSN